MFSRSPSTNGKGVGARACRACIPAEAPSLFRESKRTRLSTSSPPRITAICAVCWHPVSSHMKCFPPFSHIFCSFSIPDERLLAVFLPNATDTLDPNLWITAHISPGLHAGLLRLLCCLPILFCLFFLHQFKLSRIYYCFFLKLDCPDSLTRMTDRSFEDHLTARYILHFLFLFC